MIAVGECAHKVCISCKLDLETLLGTNQELEDNLNTSVCPMCRQISPLVFLEDPMNLFEYFPPETPVLPQAPGYRRLQIVDIPYGAIEKVPNAREKEIIRRTTLQDWSR